MRVALVFQYCTAGYCQKCFNRERGPTIATTAKQEIISFLESKEAGTRSENSRINLLNAAQSIFTANGLYCPIQVIDVKGQTYLINRDIAKLANSNGNHNSNINANANGNGSVT